MLVEICRRFRGTYWIHLQGGRWMHTFLHKLNAGRSVRSKVLQNVSIIVALWGAKPTSAGHPVTATVLRTAIKELLCTILSE
jgi:hypothetical protein